MVVVAPSFSVGTARLYSCSSLARETAGLMRACAEAAETITSAANIAAAQARSRFRMDAPSLAGYDDAAAAKLHPFARRR